MFQTVVCREYMTSFFWTCNRNLHSRIWVFLLHPTKDLFYVRWVPGAPKLKLSQISYVTRGRVTSVQIGQGKCSLPDAIEIPTLGSLTASTPLPEYLNIIPLGYDLLPVDLNILTPGQVNTVSQVLNKTLLRINNYAIGTEIISSQNNKT